MDLLSELLKKGSDPGKYLSEELKEAILPVTEQIASLERRLEKIEKSLVTLARFAELLQKIPFLRPKQ